MAGALQQVSMRGAASTAQHSGAGSPTPPVRSKPGTALLISGCPPACGVGCDQLRGLSVPPVGSANAGSCHSWFRYHARAASISCATSGCCRGSAAAAAAPCCSACCSACCCCCGSAAGSPAAAACGCCRSSGRGRGGCSAELSAMSCSSGSSQPHRCCENGGCASAPGTVMPRRRAISSCSSRCRSNSCAGWRKQGRRQGQHRVGGRCAVRAPDRRGRSLGAPQQNSASATQLQQHSPPAHPCLPSRLRPRTTAALAESCAATGHTPALQQAPCAAHPVLLLQLRLRSKGLHALDDLVEHFAACFSGVPIDSEPPRQGAKAAGEWGGTAGAGGSKHSKLDVGLGQQQAAVHSHARLTCTHCHDVPSHSSPCLRTPPSLRVVNAWRCRLRRFHSLHVPAALVRISCSARQRWRQLRRWRRRRRAVARRSLALLPLPLGFGLLPLTAGTPLTAAAGAPPGRRCSTAFRAGAGPPTRRCRTTCRAVPAVHAWPFSADLSAAPLSRAPSSRLPGVRAAAADVTALPADGGGGRQRARRRARTVQRLDGCQARQATYACLPLWVSSCCSQPRLPCLENRALVSPHLGCSRSPRPSGRRSSLRRSSWRWRSGRWALSSCRARSGCRCRSSRRSSEGCRLCCSCR